MKLQQITDMFAQQSLPLSFVGIITDEDAEDPADSVYAETDETKSYKACEREIKKLVKDIPEANLSWFINAVNTLENVVVLVDESEGSQEAED